MPNKKLAETASLTETSRRRKWDIPKAACLAGIRIAAATVLIYAGLGCVMFPLWWKEFIFGGGCLKSVFWRFGFNYLANEIRQLTPLAVMFLASSLLAAGILLFRLGRYSAQAKQTKLSFIRNLAPNNKALILIASFCVVLSLSTLIQAGWFSDAKTNELGSSRLQASLKNYEDLMGYTWGPPRTGLYEYLNDGLITKQYQALQGEMEPKQRTETLGKEKSGSLSISLGAADISASDKNTKGLSTTFAAPDVSAPLLATRLITKFATDTNVLRWMSLLSPFNQSSDFILRMLDGTGIKLSADQLEKLAAHDRAQLDSEVAKLQPPKVLIFHGPFMVRRTNDTFMLEATLEGRNRAVMSGRLRKEYLAESLLFSVEAKTPDQTLVGLEVLAIMESITKETNGDYHISITPECIW
jgi:hypothetical protein